MLPYARRLKPLSQALRREPTQAEAQLWKRLRRRQVHGALFLRQKPLAGYIADFYCAAARLVVEVDGGQHLAADTLEYDRVRTQVLEGLVLHVLRFDNRQVLVETEVVVTEIAAAVRRQIPPGPPFSKGGDS